jgi:hypothetical protein
MTKDGAKKLREAAAEAEEQAMARIQSGELRHLHGKPLDLSDDSPGWFATKLLKREGFSHPLIERGRELAVVQRETDRVLERLRRRYEALTSAVPPPTEEQTASFNTGREGALDDYREALRVLNRAVMFHNLAVPESLHRRPILIDDTLERVAREIPALDPPRPPLTTPSWWRRLWRHVSR